MFFHGSPRLLLSWNWCDFSRINPFLMSSSAYYRPTWTLGGFTTQKATKTEQSFFGSAILNSTAILFRLQLKYLPFQPLVLCIWSPVLNAHISPWCILKPFFTRPLLYRLHHNASAYNYRYGQIAVTVNIRLNLPKTFSPYAKDTNM